MYWPVSIEFAKQFGRRLAALILFAAIFEVPGVALDSSKTLTQYAHRIWGQEEGLFQPTIYSILQTRDGFLWLGTQDSLIRFDGKHFREFGDPGEASFQHTLIRVLLQDAQGNSVGRIFRCGRRANHSGG